MRRLLIIAGYLVTSCVVGLSQTYLSGLQSWWKLDELNNSYVIKVDAAGTNHLRKSASAPTVTTGLLNNCSVFLNSSTRYLTHTRNAGLGGWGTNEFAVEAWVYLTSNSADRQIMGMWNSAGAQREWLMYYIQSVDRYRFAFSTNGASSGGQYSVQANTFGSPPLNAWTRIVAWKDNSNNTLNIQVNGGGVDTITNVVNPMFTSTTAFYLGWGGADVGVAWDGSIDETAVWNRALTSQERLDLYNGGVGVSISPRATNKIVISPDASRVSVQSMLYSAAPGDTVKVPSGTNYYNASLILDQSQILLAPYDGTNSCWIVDEVVDRSKSVLSLVLTDTNFTPRVAGFRFKGGVTNNAKNFTTGVIGITGNNHQFRIDHCKFQRLNGPNVIPKGYLWGVLDHIDWDTNGNQDSQVNMESWAGGNNGNGSWADDPYPGTERAIYFEDNVFREVQPELSGIDLYNGAHVVVRYNISTNGIFTLHGTEGIGRGGRWAEIYNNEWYMTVAHAAGQWRSGGGVVFSNNWHNFTAGFSLQAYRQFQTSAVWGNSNGSNPYDSNCVSCLVYTGTHNGTNSSTILVDSTASFPANLHNGYIISNPSSKRTSYITSNTGTTVSYFLDVGEGGNLPFMLFNTGQTYYMSNVVMSLDQPGMGKGDLLSGLPGLPAQWPNEVLDPMYSWDNTGLATVLGGPSGTIRQNTNYFNLTPRPGYTSFTYPHPLRQLPGSFTNTIPANGAVNQNVVQTFTWTSPGNDTLLYDVYIDTVNPPVTLVQAGWGQNIFGYSALNINTTYYWKIVAYNFDGATTNTVTSFNTGTPIPADTRRPGVMKHVIRNPK